MSKWFWVVLLVVVAGLVGVFAVANKSSDPDNSEPAQNPQEVTATDHLRGNPNAKVTLIEYGDFQCPACGATYPLLKQLDQEFGDRVRVVFRHFPLTSIHPNAFSASRAAEAAGSFGKFFEMHDILYERQQQWSADTNALKLFREYARELGVDSNAFNDAYNSDEVTDRINSDVGIAQDLGATATPTFFLNGQKMEPNPRNYEDLKTQVEAALASAG